MVRNSHTQSPRGPCQNQPPVEPVDYAHVRPKCNEPNYWSARLQKNEKADYVELGARLSELTAQRTLMLTM